MDSNWLFQRLRSDEGILVLPGAYDALSARLLALADTEAVYCGGFAATAAQYGLPDLGLLGLADMAGMYTRIRAACKGKPLIVDADAGHGGLLNVERTISTFASAGITAFHIEDQVLPKRCGHLAGKDVVEKNDAVARVRTAVRCASEHHVAVIARTDAIAVHGFEDAVCRANAFLGEGAAAVFIDAPTSPEQIASIPRLVKGPVVFNAAPTGITKPSTNLELQEMGYAAVLHPLVTIMAATEAILDRFPPAGKAAAREEKLSFAALSQILETNEFLKREQRWSGIEPHE